MEIERLADACGGLAWISERLFEIEGRLTAGHGGGLLDARVQVVLARSSRRFGQHALWWRDALPDSPALDGASRVGPPSDRWAQIMNDIGEHVESARLDEAVAELFEIALPELELTLDQLMAEASPVSDGAVIRIARMVAADVAEDRSEFAEVTPRRQLG